MFHSVTSAASKVAGAASNVVSGTVSFSEEEVMKHIKAFTAKGSRSSLQEYVVKECENIKERAPGDVDVDVDLIPAPADGASHLKNNVILNLSPKYNNNNNNNNNILVYSSAAIREETYDDDDTSNVAVMLELARGLSPHANEFKNSVTFFFNIYEEEEEEEKEAEGLKAARRYMHETRVAIDLEGWGIGGKKSKPNRGSSVSEKTRGGLKDPVIVLFGNDGENQPLKQGVFPATTINMKEKPLKLQDIFNHGNVQSSTGNTAVHHSKNEGSIQTLGENLLPFLVEVAGDALI